jgi:hypothetical protein
MTKKVFPIWIFLISCSLGCGGCGLRTGTFVAFTELPITASSFEQLRCESAGWWSQSDISGKRIEMSGVLARSSMEGLTNSPPSVGRVMWTVSASPTSSMFIEQNGMRRERTLASGSTRVYHCDIEQGGVWMRIHINAETRQFTGSVVRRRD